MTELQKKCFDKFIDSLQDEKILHEHIEVSGISNKDTLIEIEYNYIIQASDNDLRDVYSP